MQKRGHFLDDLLGHAGDLLSREQLLEAGNAGYRALRDDAEGWREELAERSVWEATLGDNQESS